MKNSLEEQNKSIVRKYWDGKWNERRPKILKWSMKSIGLTTQSDKKAMMWSPKTTL